MNLYYICDIGFYFNENSIYTTRSNINALSRFSENFDRIIIICRNRKNVINGNNIVLNEKYDMTVLEDIKISDGFSYFHKSIANKEKMNNILSNCNQDDIVMGIGLNGSMGLRIAKKKGLCTVGYIGGSGILSAKTGLKIDHDIMQFIKNLTFHFFEKKLVKNSDYMQYVAPFLKETYPTTRPCLISSSVLIRPITKDVILRRKHKRNNFTIGIVGFLSDFKGTNFAIKLLQQLPTECSLKFAGRGDNSQYSKLAKINHVKDRTFFLGQLNTDSEIFNFLDEVDIYIQPSLSEGLPRATIEAMSRGCPVLANSVGGLVDIVQKENLFSVNDIDGYVKRINEIFADEKLLEEMQDYSFETAHQFENDIIQCKYDKFWKEIINEI